MEMEYQYFLPNEQNFTMCAHVGVPQCGTIFSFVTGKLESVGQTIGACA
jgi:hypothetical protein